VGLQSSLNLTHRTSLAAFFACRGPIDRNRHKRRMGGGKSSGPRTMKAMPYTLPSSFGRATLRESSQDPSYRGNRRSSVLCSGHHHARGSKSRAYRQLPASRGALGNHRTLPALTDPLMTCSTTTWPRSFQPFNHGNRKSRRRVPTTIASACRSV
jgi:hypothetical protein